MIQNPNQFHINCNRWPGKYDSRSVVQVCNRAHVCKLSNYSTCTHIHTCYLFALAIDMIVNYCGIKTSGSSACIWLYPELSTDSLFTG